MIETLIGRLLTDETFRNEFLADPALVLRRLHERGVELTPTETAALVNTDRELWARAAEAIDPRLQKASLQTDR